MVVVLFDEPEESDELLPQAESPSAATASRAVAARTLRMGGSLGRMLPGRVYG